VAERLHEAVREGGGVVARLLLRQHQDLRGQAPQRRQERVRARRRGRRGHATRLRAHPLVPGAVFFYLGSFNFF
jgi:hypothetical protein